MTSRTASTRSVLTRVARWVALAATVLVAVWAWPASLGGCTTFVLVSGGSMEPTYATGDLLVARCGEAAVGDVVVYEPPTAAGSLVVHRIVGGDPSAWVLQGDANDWLDPWTPGQEHVVGRVVAHVPGLGLAPWVLDPLVWASVIVAGLGVWLWPSRPSREGAASPDAGGPPEADGPALDAGAAPGAAGARRSWRHRAAAGTAGAAVVALLAVAALPAPASAARVAVDAAGLAVRTQEVDLPAPAALPAICATSPGRPALRGRRHGAQRVGRGLRHRDRGARHANERCDRPRAVDPHGRPVRAALPGRAGRPRVRRCAAGHAVRGPPLLVLVGVTTWGTDHPYLGPGDSRRITLRGMPTAGDLPVCR